MKTPVFAMAGRALVRPGLLAIAALALWSCSQPDGKPAADCEPAAGPGAKPDGRIERIPLGRVGERENRDGDWCRACVWSKAGFASCQRVFAKDEGEARESIRARARAKACQDAEWPGDACPDDKLISMLCRGDGPAPGTKNPGDALQDLYRQLNPGKFQHPPKAAGTAPDGGAPPSAPIVE